MNKFHVPENEMELREVDCSDGDQSDFDAHTTLKNIKGVPTAELPDSARVLKQKRTVTVPSRRQRLQLQPSDP